MSIAWDEMRLMMICCGKSEEDGNVRSEWREMKTLNVNTGYGTLIGKGKYNLTCSVY
jgi:hypothetical protein